MLKAKDISCRACVVVKYFGPTETKPARYRAKIQDRAPIFYSVHVIPDLPRSNDEAQWVAERHIQHAGLEWEIKTSTMYNGEWIFTV